MRYYSYVHGAAILRTGVIGWYSHALISRSALGSHQLACEKLTVETGVYPSRWLCPQAEVVPASRVSRISPPSHIRLCSVAAATRSHPCKRWPLLSMAAEVGPVFH